MSTNKRKRVSAKRKQGRPLAGGVLVVEAARGVGGGVPPFRLELLEQDPPGARGQSLSNLYLSLDDRQGGDTVSPMSTKRPVPCVAYIRVSTEEQSKSGLGLEAQEHACRESVEDMGGRLVEVIREQDSGDNDDRPGLAKALALVARLRGVLVVSKLDRLARSVALVARTLRAGVKVRVASSPEASVLELHLRAALAQEERRLIGERTKAALAAAKARGTKLGSARAGHWKGREAARLRGAKAATAAAAAARREAAAPLLAQAAPIVAADENASLRQLAAELERAGVATATGCQKWSACGVARLRKALAAG
jgi:DNA invertase Pin-like site-specific DNA recombinase